MKRVHVTHWLTSKQLPVPYTSTNIICRLLQPHRDILRQSHSLWAPSMLSHCCRRHDRLHAGSTCQICCHATTPKSRCKHHAQLEEKRNVLRLGFKNQCRQHATQNLEIYMNRQETNGHQGPVCKQNLPCWEVPKVVVAVVARSPRAHHLPGFRKKTGFKILGNICRASHPSHGPWRARRNPLAHIWKSKLGDPTRRSCARKRLTRMEHNSKKS